MNCFYIVNNFKMAAVVLKTDNSCVFSLLFSDAVLFIDIFIYYKIAFQHSSIRRPSYKELNGECGVTISHEAIRQFVMMNDSFKWHFKND